MWDFPDQSFVPFPSFIDAFRFKLGEGCEITLEFCHFRWGKYFMKELVCHLIPRCYGFLGKELNHVFALSFKEKRKSFRFITSGDTPFILCVSHISKKLKMCSFGMGIPRIDMCVAPFELISASAQSFFLELLVQ